MDFYPDRPHQYPRFYHRHYAIKRYYALKRLREQGWTGTALSYRNYTDQPRLPVEEINNNEHYSRHMDIDESLKEDAYHQYPYHERDPEEEYRDFFQVPSYKTFLLYLAKAPVRAISWAYHHGKTYWLYLALGAVYLNGIGALDVSIGAFQ